MEPILVTGATGKIGGAVATELLLHGVPVRALVRSVDARSEQLRSKGAHIVVGDSFDYDSLFDALAGTTRAFYCPPMDPYIAQGAMAFALAASDAGIRSIVGLSQRLANPAGVADAGTLAGRPHVCPAAGDNIHDRQPRLFRGQHP